MDLSNYNRIVVKIGSSSITSEKGTIKLSWLRALADDITELMSAGKDVIIVTSGSVAQGRKYLANKKHKLKLEEKQAAFACGQIDIMKSYTEAFNPRPVGQVLLTIHDTERRRNYLNAKSAIDTMIENAILPVINENDIVATSELRYGDNDRLSARVAQMLGADLLILLSDIDGLYDKNPNEDPTAKHIEEVTKITKSIRAMAGDATSKTGTGGMHTKISAAKIAMNAGCDCVISNGLKKNPVKKLFDNKAKHTLFKSRTNKLNARQTWIISGVEPYGEISVDKGAMDAIVKGRSLLPVGVTKIKGIFQRGDLVTIKHEDKIVAKGLSSIASRDAKKIKGKNAKEIESILGYIGRTELVRRDDMVITIENL